MGPGEAIDSFSSSYHNGTLNSPLNATSFDKVSGQYIYQLTRIISVSSKCYGRNTNLIFFRVPFNILRSFSSLMISCVHMQFTEIYIKYLISFYTLLLILIWFIIRKSKILESLRSSWLLICIETWTQIDVPHNQRVMAGARSDKHRLRVSKNTDGPTNDYGKKANVEHFSCRLRHRIVWTFPNKVVRNCNIIVFV